MASDDYIKKFTAAMVFSSRMSSGVKDQLFLQKLYRSLSDLSRAHAAFLKEENEKNISEVSHCIRRVMDSVDYCEHLELAALIPLLQARQALLRLARVFSTKKEKTRPITQPVKNTSEHASPPKPRQELLDQPHLSENQEKIFKFIRQSPNVRAKDIIDGFGLLSDRTVKRSLKELINSGLIKKKEENRAVYYFPTEIN